MEYISTSVEKTYQFAKNVALNSKPGDVYALIGDLGAGKTAFVKGFASFFKIKREITSPTFVIMKQYKIEGYNDLKNLIHIDCYRLKSSMDAESIGIKEILSLSDAIVLIEWPEIISDVLPKRTKNIVFQYLNQEKRKIIYEK